MKPLLAPRVLHLTDIGRAMAEFPLHPRLSRMLMEAVRRGCVDRACLWAALISERSILMGDSPRDLAEPGEGEPRSDLLVMERLFDKAAAAQFDVRTCDRMNLNAQACREVDRTRRQLSEICEDVARDQSDRRESRERSQQAPRSRVADLFICLLTAFPDHVAYRPDAARLDCRMIGKKRVVIDKGSAVAGGGPALLLAMEIRETGAGDGVKTSLSINSEIEPALLEEAHPDRIAVRDEVEWNAQVQAVEQVESHTFDGLVFYRKARQQVDPAKATDILVEEIVRGNLKLEKWDETVEQWITRTRLVARWFPDRGLIAYEPDDLRVILHEIVSAAGPGGGAVRFSQIKDKPCLQALKDALSWEDQRFVEQMAPQTIKLPNGWGMKVEYTPDGPPRGRAKIQDFYGLNETPRVAGGKVPVVLEILGPNYRPVQVTDNLASFWANTYPELKKELKRRYPRHEWR